MRRQITIGCAQRRKPITQHQKMSGLIIGNAKPVAIKIPGETLRDISARHVKRQINGIEFDMGNRMQQSDTPAVACCDTAARHIAGWQQCRLSWPGWTRWRRRIAKLNRTVGMPVGYQLAGKPGFFMRVCCVQRGDDAGCQGNGKRHRLHGFDKFENFGGMPIDFDFWPDSGDVAGAIDDKGGALNAHIGFAIH